MTLRWGLVGRGEELQLLRAALADVGTRGAVLSGAAGVGKTRLATELLEYAADQGWATQRAVGTRAVAGVPFGAFAHLLPPGDDTARLFAVLSGLLSVRTCRRAWGW